MAKKGLVLVTGVSGYLGSHVVDRLVAWQGYKVRGIARNPKVAQVQAVYDKAYGSGVEMLGADDLTAGDYTAAVEGNGGMI